MNNVNFDWEQIISSVAQAIVITDAELSIQWFNAAATALLPLEAACASGKTFDQLLQSGAKGDPEPATQLNSLLASPSSTAIDIEASMQHRDGSLFSASIKVSSFGTCNTAGFAIAINDITAQQKALQALSLSAQVFEHSGEPIMITDTLDRILDVNRAFVAMTEYSREEVIGQTPDFLRTGLGEDAVYAKMWDKTQRDGHWGGEVFNRKKSGEAFPTWLSISAVRDNNNAICHYISIFSDISAHSDELHELRHLAAHDFLTGLPNRILLEDRFRQAVVGRKRSSKKYIGVLFVDLDGFKRVNDVRGHECGDQLLKRIATVLRNCVRAQDTVCRYGGDEFIILLSDLSHKQDVNLVAQKVLQGIADLSAPATAHVSASVGISYYPDHAQDLPELLQCADRAMYEAKAQGKNRYRIWSPAA